MRLAGSMVMLAATLVLGATMAAPAADTQPAAGSVSGTVMLKDGKTAAAGATIKVLAVAADRSHDPTEIKSLAANQDGTFKVADLAAGGYILKFASGDQVGNKSAQVKAGKDTPMGKIVLKVESNTGKKSEPKNPGSGGGKKG